MLIATLEAEIAARVMETAPSAVREQPADDEQPKLK